MEANVNSLDDVGFPSLGTVINLTPPNRSGSDWESYPASGTVNIGFSVNQNFFVAPIFQGGVFIEDSEKPLRELVERTLGPRAERRFAELAQIQSGWGSGQGRAMDERAKGNLATFLTNLTQNLPEVRLFLLTDGSIELTWDRKEEIPNSLIVKASGFEVFHENEEDAFSESDLSHLLQALALEDASHG